MLPPPVDRAALQAEAEALRSRLAEIELHLAEVACSIPLKRAAGVWGLSYNGAWKRAQRLEALGLAEHRRPGGWWVSERAVR